MPAPSYIAKSAFASGTGALSVGAVSGVVADDLILLFIESENQVVPSVPTGGAGGTWVEVSGSPQGTGTAAAAGAVRLTVYYQIATGADATTTVADTGDHTCAIKVCIRGADTATPFDATSGNVQASAATTLNMPTVTTSVADCLIVYGIALDIDGASTARIGTVTNANLTTITERHDQTVATADGGGIGVITGVKATAGAVGTTTVAVTSTIATYLTMAIKPLTLVERTGDLAATETGNDTAASTGTVLVQGSGAATETGEDTFAASGTVTDPAITGDLAATESGNDTATVSGKVIVGGSLSASEAGSDTFTSSGLIIVSGALSVSEVGDDTFAGTGFGVTLTTGSLDATESGDDTASATGTVLVSGSLTVSESGDDTFSASGTVADAPVTGDMSATETADTTDTYAGDYVEGGYYQTGWYGSVLAQGAMSATEDGQDGFFATDAVPVQNTAVSGGNAQKEWENRQKYRQEAKRIIELLEPVQEPVQDVVQQVALVEQVAPDFSLTKAIAEGMTLGLTIDPLMLAIEQKRINDAAEQARLLMALIEQEREAVAVAWFLAEVA